MSFVARKLVGGSAILLAIIGLPLVGAVAAGRDVRSVFRFPPPLEILTDYVRFSWIAAGLVFLAIAGFAVGWVAGARSRRGAGLRPAKMETKVGTAVADQRPELPS